jgi:hypothetical protein
LAERRNVPITSLVTLPPEPDDPRRRLVLRIGTIQAKPFIQALQEAGIETDVPIRTRLGRGRDG